MDGDPLPAVAWHAASGRYGRSRRPRSSGPDRVAGRMGHSAAAEVAIERALDLAERDTLVFPFVMTAPRSLLERHPRHSTAHAALLSDIIDLLAGAALKAPPTTDQLPEPLTGGELRVLRYLPSNLCAPIARARLNRTVSPRPDLQRTDAERVSRKSESVPRSTSATRTSSRPTSSTSDVVTRRSGSLTACPWSSHTAPGRCYSTWSLSAAIRRTSHGAFSTTRWPRHRWLVGAVTSPLGTSASCSATSRWSASPYLVSACGPLSPTEGRRGNHRSVGTIGRSPARPTIGRRSWLSSSCLGGIHECQSCVVVVSTAAARGDLRPGARADRQLIARG